MAQFFQIHPDNPQKRLIQQAVEIIRGGGLVVYPTDSSYALGCHIGDKAAMERICQLRELNARHNFTLVCSDMSEVSAYAKVGNSQYRMLRNLCPGPYTFIFPATREVPRRLQQGKKKTIGLRIPDNRIAQDLLAALGEPIVSSTLLLPGDDMPLSDPYEMRQILEHQVDLIIDGGYCGYETTTVVDMSDDLPEVLREGKGDIAPFEAL